MSELITPLTKTLLAEQLVRDVPDFPTPGILFKDITPALANFDAMREVFGHFYTFGREMKPDVVVGIESRGFVLGMPLSQELGVGFVPVRKPGKLPYTTICEEYTLEYGTNALEIHIDAIAPGMRTLIIDDLLATGGTASAACRLVERLGGVVCGLSFMIELGFLKGRRLLQDRAVQGLITYP